MSADGRERDVVAFGDVDGDARDGDGLPSEGDLAAERDGRRGTGRWAAALVTDRRRVPVVAALAAVAAFGSLVNPWVQITSDTEIGPVTNWSGLMETGVYGHGYMVGLLALSSAVSLVLFGPPSTRHPARVIGLTLTGATIALLIALRVTYGGFESSPPPLEGQSEVYVYVTGLTLAFLALVLAGLALVLAGRHLGTTAGVGAGAGTAAGAARRSASADGGAAPRDHPGAAAHDWGWRPPHPPDDETAKEVAAAAPLDLTVEPARPFVPPHGGRSGRDGDPPQRER